MEFSNAYGFSTDFSSCTKNLLYHWATFYNEDGSIIEKRDKRSLAKILQVNPIYAKLDKATEDIKVAMRYAQPLIGWVLIRFKSDFRLYSVADR